MRFRSTLALGATLLLGGLQVPAESQPLDECSACRRDATSPSGFSQMCRIGGRSVKVPCDGLSTPQPSPRPTQRPGDDDRDGLLDSDEQRLLLKFAPQIWLHPDETRFPVNVDWLLRRATLRFSHARCSDHEILAFGQVTASNLGQQTHRAANDPLTSFPWNACDHTGATLRSNSFVSDPRTSFFLQYRDATHNGTSRRANWRLYGHVFPAGSSTMIQYWQLYAYNDSFASANHEGDWEYTGVLVDANETPLNVVHFRHGRNVVSSPSRVQWEGTHHLTFVAKGGHAQYRNFVRSESCVCEDTADCAQGFADRCSQGTAWNSWEPRFGGIVNVGERRRPLPGSEWLEYSGIWGEVGAAAGAIRFTSGPLGPAYQEGNWLFPR